MSVQKATFLIPPLRPEPPGALWLANAVGWLFGSDRRSSSGLAAWFEALRAKSAVERAARREGRARDALMALARRYESTQPSFAKDLVAAASTDRR